MSSNRAADEYQKVLQWVRRAPAGDYSLEDVATATGIDWVRVEDRILDVRSLGDARRLLMVSTREGDQFPHEWPTFFRLGDLSVQSFVLPYPPSVNRYWRTVGGRPILSREARVYRGRLIDSLNSQRFEPVGKSRVAVEILAEMPDKRRRDLDNIRKALFDSLTHAGLWDDDSQIDDDRAIRGPVRAPGCIRLTVKVIDYVETKLAA